MIGLGVDPSLTKTAWAQVRKASGTVAEQDGTIVKRDYFEVLSCGVITARSNTKGLQLIREIPKWQVPYFDYAVVERMQKRNKGAGFRGKSDASDILNLSTVVGAVYMHLTDVRRQEEGVRVPAVVVKTPMEWKGTMGKGDHHPLVCSRVGWEYVPKKRPIGAEDFEIANSYWYDVLDAIGMALYALDTCKILDVEWQVSHIGPQDVKRRSRKKNQ